MISAAQIKLIRVAASRCGLDEETYRALIAGFGVEHTRDLNTKDVNTIISKFRQMGFKQTTIKNVTPKKPEHCRITQSQLDYIAAMWKEKSRAKDIQSLNKLCKKITGIDNISWLMKTDASKLIAAVKNLG